MLSSRFCKRISVCVRRTKLRISSEQPSGEQRGMVDSQECEPMDFDKESVPAAFPSISHCGDSFLKGGSEGLGSLYRGKCRVCAAGGR